MHISTEKWRKFTDKLSKLNKTAGEKMIEYVQKNGFSDTEAIIDYAYALATKYGEASATLNAQMYDEIAEMSGFITDPAELAPTATYKETAKAVARTLEKSVNPNSIAGTVGRLVKRAGADTMLLNAYRDNSGKRKKYVSQKRKHSGAQFAWVPSGDTCAFCLMLASRGWQNQTNWAKDNHASHIHANCDCSYAVRFDDHTTVGSYDPAEYRKIWDEAEGETQNEKINYLRRKQHEDPEIREKQNAQKREADALLKSNRRLFVDETEAGISNLNNNTASVAEASSYTAPDGKTYEVNGKDIVVDQDAEERKTAELLSKVTGENVKLCPRVSGNNKKVSTPDYLVGDQNVKWDRKGLHGAGKDALRDTIKKKERQADRFVIDITEWKGNEKNIIEQAEKVFEHKNTSFVKELILIKNGKIVRKYKR